MPYKNLEKAKESALERQRRYRVKLHAQKYGSEAGDMRGRHGNHAKGKANGRWNNNRMRTSHGYMAVKVQVGHHLRQAHGYAYEHDLVAEGIIERWLLPNEIVHHRNGVRDDNRPENLIVETRSYHAREHGTVSGIRNAAGQFISGKKRLRDAHGGDPAEWPEDLRVREMPIG